MLSQKEVVGVTKIKIKEVSDLETVKKMIAYKLSERLGFGTLVLDPYGHQLLFLLDVAEREFGEEAKKELEEFLMPYHKVRVLQVLQEEGIKQKFWLVAPVVGAKPIEDVEEEFELSTDNEKDEQKSVTRETAKVEKLEDENNFEDLEFEEEEEDDELLF